MFLGNEVFLALWYQLFYWHLGVQKIHMLTESIKLKY